MKTSSSSRLFLILTIFSASCSKKENVPEDPKTTRIVVVEYKTNKPIVGAIVEYYKPCPECGFQPAYNIVLSKRTVDSGYCEIPVPIFNNSQYGILISPPAPPQTQPPISYDYWQTGSPGVHSSATKYELPITGEEKLHLIKINDFPKGYYMDIKSRGELASFQEIDIARVYAFPSDTSFSFWTYRGQTNTISWNIYDSTDMIISRGGPLLVDMPRESTVETELKY